MKRILALDYGEKRIGIAISDPLGLTAQSLPFIPNDDNKLKTLASIISEYKIETIILGNPKHMNGSVSQKSKQVMIFADLIKTIFAGKILLRDERLSTLAMQKHFIKAGLRRNKRKQVIDSASAVFVLQGYLDSFSSY